MKFWQPLFMGGDLQTFILLINFVIEQQAFYRLGTVAPRHQKMMK